MEWQFRWVLISQVRFDGLQRVRSEAAVKALLHSDLVAFFEVRGMLREWNFDHARLTGQGRCEVFRMTLHMIFVFEPKRLES